MRALRLKAVLVGHPGHRVGLAVVRDEREGARHGQGLRLRVAGVLQRPSRLSFDLVASLVSEKSKKMPGIHTRNG